MQFLKTVILFIGVYSSYAAPASPNPAQQKLQEDLKNALEPVQEDMRAMVENAQSAVGDLTKSLAESGSNILETGRGLLTPIGQEDRANIPGALSQRINELKNSVIGSVRSLLNRAADDFKPVIANEKSGLINLKSAGQALGDIYLTKDGQDLVKTVLGALPG